MKNITLSILFCLLFAVASFAQNSDIRKEIDTQNSKITSFVSNQDLAIASTIYSREAQLLPPNGKMFSGKENIKSFWTMAFKNGVDKVKIDSLELVQMGDLAYEVRSFELYINKKLFDVGKSIIIWKKENGTWLMHRDIWNSSRESN